MRPNLSALILLLAACTPPGDCPDPPPPEPTCEVDPATNLCGCGDVPGVDPRSCGCAMYEPGVCWCGAGCSDDPPGAPCDPYPDETCIPRT